ncbi:MAG: LCP family protein [Anaerolineae bacterium]|nr:LCP family protein [Anaerolineae bacterium]
MNREGVDVRRPPFRWSQLVYALLFVALLAAGLYCGYLAYTTIRDFAAHTQFRSISIPGFLAPTAQPPAQAARPDQPGTRPDAPQTSYVIPSIENKERVNILVMGIDQRPGESVACRTDTLMLASVNPKDMSVSVLSIPRDLWLEIPHPNHTKDRVNTAHYWGEVEEYPGGGPALAMKTIEHNFGVPVHYYVRLNFTGFERIIDYIGGIDVEVPVTIDDYKYPSEDNGTEHLHIDAGLNHFDGEMALKYARTRQGTGDGDFSRMERQLQVILAIRDQALALKHLPQLVLQAPKLLREMGDSVETNIPVQEMLVLAQWAQDVPRENIRTATINRELTDDWATPKGEMVLLYDRAKARPVIDAMFSDPTPEAQTPEASPVERLAAERARVAVYNGTEVEDLSAYVQSFLAMQGIDAYQIDIADAPSYERTVVRIYGEKPYTAQWVIAWLIEIGIPEPVIEQPMAQADADIAVLIGSDFPVSKID